MFLGNQYIKTWVPSLILGLAIAGCSETKFAQCEKFIGEVNEGTSLLEKNKGEQVTTSLQLSQDLEKISKSIEDLSLRDETLQGFQSEFAQIFITFSENIGKAGKALGAAKNAKANAEGRNEIKKSRKNIESAFQVAESAAKEYDKLAKQLNQYCTAPES